MENKILVLFPKNFQTFSSNGTGPCHVKVHTGYGLLHVSNYGGGSFTSYKIDENSGEIKGMVLVVLLRL